MADTNEDIEKAENLPEDPAPTAEEERKSTSNKGKSERKSKGSSDKDEDEDEDEGDEEGEEASSFMPSQDYVWILGSGERKKKRQSSKSVKRQSKSERRPSKFQRPDYGNDEEEGEELWSGRHGLDDEDDALGAHEAEGWDDEEGEEGEEEEEAEEEETEVVIHYNTEDYISGPIRVEHGTVPIGILEFQYPTFSFETKTIGEKT